MDRLHWTDRGYRGKNYRVAINPAMLSGDYERIIDGSIVQFDRDYVVKKVLYQIRMLDQDDQQTILGESIDRLRNYKTEEDNERR